MPIDVDLFKSVRANKGFFFVGVACDVVFWAIS